MAELEARRLLSKPAPANLVIALDMAISESRQSLKIRLNSNVEGIQHGTLNHVPEAFGYTG
jgi:hypothetical protein